MTQQEEIKNLIHSYGIKLGWLADKLGLKVQTLSYLLNEPTKFDESLYTQIKELIDSYQLEFGFFADDSTQQNFNLFDDEEVTIGIGERIRIFAKRKFGTLKKLAQEMGISPQQLQQYISGKREPGSRILNRLLKLGCDINWLLGGSESVESYRIYLLENELRKLQNSINEISKIVEKHKG